jgi:hypothetical protein
VSNPEGKRWPVRKPPECCGANPASAVLMGDKTFTFSEKLLR